MRTSTSAGRYAPLIALLCLALSATARAEVDDRGNLPPPGPQPMTATPPTTDREAAKKGGVPPPQDPEKLASDGFQIGDRDPNAYAIVSVSRGLSTHRPMYVLPAAYGRGVEGLDTEMEFQISAKQRLFASNFFFGYTQKSFWQIYDQERSRPFRETNYNPEFFYRWTPDPEIWHHWGLDVGLEHESNGQSLPDSRSWNRLYITPFQAKGRNLRYIKFWYRLPEDRKDDAMDPKGDDNPDIYRFMGYAEAHVKRQLGGGSLGDLMVRGNPSTGKGAISLNYTWPSNDGYMFYMLRLFHGYGESLIDYNRSITRIGFGFAFTR